MADALEKADEATGKATSEAAAKRNSSDGAPSFGRRPRTSNWTRTARVNNCARASTPPIALPTIRRRPHRSITWWESGMWTRVFSSTDQDWRSDGTCVSRHIYENGHELDLKNDVCTWKYKPIAGHDDEFEMDWASKMLGPEYPKQLIFKITSLRECATSISATTRFESSVRRRSSRSARASSRLSRNKPTRTPATWRIKWSSQADSTSWERHWRPKAILRMPSRTSTRNSAFAKNWRSATRRSGLSQRRAAQSFEQLGNQQFTQATTLDQAGDGPGELYKNATAALEAYQKNLVIREQLLHAAPADVDAQHNAALASNQAGIVLYWVGRNAEGIDAIRTAVRMLENITEAHRGSPQISVDLLWSLYNLSQRSDNADRGQGFSEQIARHRDRAGTRARGSRQYAQLSQVSARRQATVKNQGVAADPSITSRSVAAASGVSGARAGQGCCRSNQWRDTGPLSCPHRSSFWCRQDRTNPVGKRTIAACSRY